MEKPGWVKRDQGPSSLSCCPRQDHYTYFPTDVSSKLFLQTFRTNVTDSSDMLLQLSTICFSKIFVLISHLGEPIPSVFTSWPTHSGQRAQIILIIQLLVIHQPLAAVSMSGLTPGILQSYLKSPAETFLRGAPIICIQKYFQHNFL